APPAGLWRARGGWRAPRPGSPCPAPRDTARRRAPGGALRALAGRPSPRARAPVRAAAGPVGLVAVARRLDRPTSTPGAPAVALVAGDRLLGATVAGAPPAGWTSAVAAGRVSVAGERFLLRPAVRLGEDVALAPGLELRA